MKYQASINLAEKNSSHTIAYDMVLSHAQGRALKILEVGCASGYWGALLQEAGHRVTGVEPDAQAAAQANNLLDQVFCGMVDDYFRLHPETRFDVISFVDVLEHTPDPHTVLLACQNYLLPGGIVIASIPNVAHLALRAMLLAGHWDYAKTGILDDSHLRFFTRNTVISLFSEAKLKILEFRATTMTSGQMVSRYGIYAPLGLRCIAWLAARDCGWMDFQYVVAANPGAMAEATIASSNQAFIAQTGLMAAWLFKIKTTLRHTAIAILIHLRSTTPK